MTISFVAIGVTFDVKKRGQAKEFLASGGMAFEGLQSEREAIEAQMAASRGLKQKSRVGEGIGSVLGGVAGASLGGPVGAIAGKALGGIVGGLFD